MKQSLSLLIPLFCLTLVDSISPNSVLAQVTPDGTTSTTVDANGNNFEIDDGDRAGDNLFHSFDEFSVPTNGEAFFNNAADIVNIFSRVTGGNISNIDGLLRVMVGRVYF
jgi:large exoprotein involved in heme utilization and adhesion